MQGQEIYRGKFMHGSVCSKVPKSITSINRRTLDSRHSALTRQIGVGPFAQNSPLVHNAAFTQNSAFKQCSAVVQDSQYQQSCVRFGADKSAVLRRSSKGRCLVKAAAATKELELPDPQSGGIDFKLIVSLIFRPDADEEESEYQ